MFNELELDEFFAGETQETEEAYEVPDFGDDNYGYAPVVENTGVSEWEDAEYLARLDAVFGKPKA